MYIIWSMTSRKPLSIVILVIVSYLLGCQETAPEAIDASQDVIETTSDLSPLPEAESRVSQAQDIVSENAENIIVSTDPPEANADDGGEKLDENKLCSILQEDLGWNKWSIQLIKDYGRPNACKSLSYDDRNPSDQLFGKVQMSWDGFEYSFEAMPPEITIRRLTITAQLHDWDNWVQKYQSILVNPSYEVNFGTDTDNNPNIETYIAKDELLNVSYSIRRSQGGRIVAVQLTSAF